MVQEFPKWMYHKDLAAVIVQDPQQQDDLGKDWAESPAAFNEPEKHEPEKKKK